MAKTEKKFLNVSYIKDEKGKTTHVYLDLVSYNALVRKIQTSEKKYAKKRNATKMN